MIQNYELKDIWQVELEILDEIDRVCKENGLRYSLGYGTLLGAVRHGGFIPWDDDIDIMMPRKDYDRLRMIWNEQAKAGFLLQDETMFDDYMNNFAKVRKDHTTFLQFESERTCKYHTGFFVDIFPGDRIAPVGIQRRIQYAALALNLLYNRSYTSGAGGFRGFAEKVLLKLVPKKYHAKVSIACGKFAQRWNKNEEAELFFPNAAAAILHLYPSKAFDTLEKRLFEGKYYSAFRDYDTILRIEFDDYMQLPPEEERVWKHYPLLVDFEHNYDELRGDQP